MSDKVTSCYNMPSNCLGGYQNFTCSEGKVGALCEECDLHGRIWGESYARASPFACGKCSEVSGNIIKIIFLNLFALVIYLLLKLKL